MDNAFFLLEMTDGCASSGYISAFNRRQRLLGEGNPKDCSKYIWLQAVGDLESALYTNESEAFSCDKCPSEGSPGDGLDEVHIGDGISEGMQVDLVPKSIKDVTEDTSSVEVNGIEHKERTIIVQPKFRKAISSCFGSGSENVTLEKVKTLMKKLKPLLGKEILCEDAIYSVLDYICSLKRLDSFFHGLSFKMGIFEVMTIFNYLFSWTRCLRCPLYF